LPWSLLARGSGGFNGDAYWSLGEIPDGVTGDMRREVISLFEIYASHVAVHMLDAQTVTHGLNDSPAGTLAWILQRWRKWSDKNGVFEDLFDRDFILTNATIYWITESIGSSIRSYRNANRWPWQPSHDRPPAIEAPPAAATSCPGRTRKPSSTTSALPSQTPLTNRALRLPCPPPAPATGVAPHGG
jgi:hypothetical protein